MIDRYQQSQMHIQEIDRIRDVEDAVARKTSLPVYNISHWDTGKHYQNAISNVISLDFPQNIYDYIYSYELSDNTRASILSKYNIPTDSSDIALVPSSTIAIINICNLLKQYGCKNVCIIQPSYFSVESCLQAFHINSFSMQFCGSLTSPTIDRLFDIKNFDAIWLTIPLYGTGAYFQKEQLMELLAMDQERHFVIIDETLSTTDAIKKLNICSSPKLFRIVSPHKIIGTNAMKFAGIIHHKDHTDAIDTELDYLSGGLMSSSKMAISHFLSANYDVCLSVSKQYIEESYQKIQKLMRPYLPQFHYSSYGGPFMTIFYAGVPYSTSQTEKFIDKVIEKTNVSILPGYLEGFGENMGFCFRINLTLDKEVLLPSLLKIISYLEQNYPS